MGELIVGPGPGMPSVLRVYSGRDLEVLQDFFPFGTPFADGIQVAGGGSGDRIFCGKFE